MSDYPGALDTWTPKTDDVDDVMAAHVNDLQDAVEAVQTELGTDPAGTATDLKTRLAVSIGGGGYLELQATSNLTISSGVITASRNRHTVGTESAAASDDLDTINGYVEGRLLLLRPLDSNQNIVIKHNTGNILCVGGVDITLDLYYDVALLVYDDGIDKWLAYSLTQAALVGASNTWTGNQYFNGGIRVKTAAASSATTLTADDHALDVSASGGAVTVTLPSAVTVGAGKLYIITKTDASANAVTVDGDGTETINGATTHALSSQYDTVTVKSNGTNWTIV